MKFCVAAVFGWMSCGVLGATADSWNAAVSGDWTNSLNWSAGYYPGAPSTPTADVILPDLGSSYTVSLSQSESINSLHVNSNAVLRLTMPAALSLNPASAVSTIDGGGQIFFDGPTSTSGAELSGGTVVIGATTTLATGTSNGYVDSLYTFTNNGTLSAVTPGKLLTITSGDSGTAAFTNNGVLIATNGATLKVRGAFTGSTLGTLQADGGSMTLIGSVNNQNNILSFSSGVVGINGSVNGGTIATSGTGRISAGDSDSSNSLYLNDVSLAGTLLISASRSATFNGSTVLASGAVSMTGQGNNLYADLSTGRGTISFDSGNSAQSNVRLPDNGSAVTIGSGLSLLATNGSGAIYDSGTIINQAAVTADGSNHSLYFNGSVQNQAAINATNSSKVSFSASLDNSGTIDIEQATASIYGLPTGSGIFKVRGGSLELNGSYNVANLLAMDLANSTYVIIGTVNNAGNTLKVSGGSNTWQMRGSTLGLSSNLNGGTLYASVGSLAIGTGSNVISGASIATDISVTGGALQLTSDTVAQNVVHLSSATFVSNGTTYAGTNSILAEGSLSSSIRLDAISPQLTVSWQNAAGGTLNTVVGHSNSVLANAGTIESRSASQVTLLTSIANSGTIRSTLGDLKFVPDLEATVTYLSLTNSGSIDLQSSADLMVGDFIQMSSGQYVDSLSSTSNESYGQIHATHALSIDGTLQLVLTDAFVPNVGDSFSLLDLASGSISGTFSSVSFPALPGGKSFVLQYSATSVKAIVVPEPSVTPLGFFFAAGMRRKRRSTHRLNFLTHCRRAHS